MSSTCQASLSFDAARLATQLGAEAANFHLEIIDECASTNSELLARAKQGGCASGHLLLARRQLAGRGRRGRGWFAAAGHSLTFSLLWQFPANTRLDGLSLAVGLAAADVLGDDICVKWPNDLLKQGRKLGGILIEMVAPQTVVIGIGLNLTAAPAMPDTLAEASAAIFERLEDDNACALLARLLHALKAALENFARAGFAASVPAWQARHAFQDKAVRLFDDRGMEQSGICRGVDATGALLLETAQGIEHITSGDLSLRPT